MAFVNAIEPITAPPAKVVEASANPEIRQRIWGLDARTDHTVTWQEYIYWAKVERAEEAESEKRYQELQGPWSFTKMIKGRFSKGVHHETKKLEEQRRREQALTTLESSGAGEKQLSEKAADAGSTSSVGATEEEWKTASRALRTASWGSIFFLVTTDILGWSGAPFVFASVGFGAGTALYIIFGIAAGLSGLMLWKTYVSLDSSRFPMLSFGDLYLRVFGRKSRHAINIAQSFQQFLTVCVLILGNGTVISQLAGPGLCFIACMIIAMVVGIITGSIRSLQRLGWICNLSVWLNVTCFVIIMYAAAHNPIDYPVVWASTLFKQPPAGQAIPAIKTFVGIPPDAYQQQVPGFAAQFNAVDTMVYAYSGALIFVAFMAEMRHPMDFWKGVLLAQAFICFVYLLFGLFVYKNFGQYSASNINQVINPEILRTVTNVFTLLTGLIACVLYFNIGMKTVYIEVFQEVLNFPNITTKKGRMMWLVLGPAYWIVAFILAAAVPNLNGIVSFIGGLLSLNFTYSFPALVYLGYLVHEGATLEGEGFDPVTGTSVQHDRGMKRMMRGFFKRWYLTIPTLAYLLCGLACSGMGTWAAVEGLISIFGPGGTVATSFGCPSPVWGNS